MGSTMVQQIVHINQSMIYNSGHTFWDSMYYSIGRF